MMNGFAILLSGVEKSGKIFPGRDFYLMRGVQMGPSYTSGWRLNKCSASLAWSSGGEGGVSMT